MADRRLGRFWAHRGKDGLKRELQLLVNFLCNVTGGPMVYAGRDMKTSPRACASTNRTGRRSWDTSTLHWIFGLTGENREAVVSFVESTKGDSVEG
jgi:hemoglobin